MRYPRFSLTAIALALLLGFVAAPHDAHAQVPESFTYQGYLEDGGTPVSANVDVIVRLFDDPNFGANVYEETHSGVAVDEGVFTVAVGTGTVASTSGDFSDVTFGQPLWLDLAIDDGDNTTELGRTPLRSVPYALGLPGIRVEPASSDEGPNIIGGWSGNTVASGVVGATISGGGDPEVGGNPYPNRVTGDYGTVSGGWNNTASGEHATVGGGLTNDATGEEATVGGGIENKATDYRTTVGGGSGNEASGDEATVGGGEGNTASGTRATVGGGDDNTASGIRATVGGGDDNTASSFRATVGGGSGNTASGSYATVPGGYANRARGDYSFAAGHDARAIHEGSFVWNDRSITSGDDSLLTTGANQFLIRAAGGVGVGTNTPQSQLDVRREVSGGATADNHVAFFENTATSSGDVLALKSNATDPGAPVNFITFKSAGDNIGAIEGNGSGGVEYKSGGGDFAELLPRQRPSEQIEAGDVVGIVGGEVTRETAGAEQVSVVTDRAAVLGNDPGEGERAGYEKVSFVGQVPVETRGAVAEGDLLVASGKGDGTARAVAPAEYDPAAHGPVVGQAWESSSGGVRRVNAVIGHAGETAALRSVVERQQDRLAALEERLAALEQARTTPLAATAVPAFGWLLGGLVLAGGLLIWRRRR